MLILPTAEDVADEAKKAGLSLIDMCDRAETAYTTYYRWRRGGMGPSITIVERWLKVIDEAVVKAIGERN